LLVLGTRVVLTALVVVPTFLAVRIGVDEWNHVGTGSVTGTAVSSRCVEKNIETTTYITCYGRFASSSGTVTLDDVRIDGVSAVGVTASATTAPDSSWVVEGTSPWRVVPRTFARCLPVGAVGIGAAWVVVMGLITLPVGWVGLSLAKAFGTTHAMGRGPARGLPPG
jgi:hypothetical protein